MDDEQDDYREPEDSAAPETSAWSEDRAESDDLESFEPPAPEVPEYTPEEYEVAQDIKARRLYKEENGRIPYTLSEVNHFLMKADIERPIRPDDEDLQAARRKLENAGS